MKRKQDKAESSSASEAIEKVKVLNNKKENLTVKTLKK